MFEQLVPLVNLEEEPEVILKQFTSAPIQHEVRQQPPQSSAIGKAVEVSSTELQTQQEQAKVTLLDKGKQIAASEDTATKEGLEEEQLDVPMGYFSEEQTE
jgi:hypothetical protein